MVDKLQMLLNYFGKRGNLPILIKYVNILFWSHIQKIE